MTPRHRSPPSHSKPRTALALAGGGPLGAIYEIGALCALDEALQGLDFNGFDHYVGVSAGGFIVAGLANGLTPRQLCEAFIEDRATEHRFDPAWLMTPAWAEFGTRLQRLPGLLGAALWDWGSVQGKSATHAFERLGAALPTGVLDNEGIHRQIEALFSRPGRSNDFRQLRARLTLVATRTRHRRRRALRAPRLGPCAHFPRDPGQCRAAGPVSARGNRRPALRRWRTQENTACHRCTGRRHRPAAVPEPAGAVSRHAGAGR